MSSHCAVSHQALLGVTSLDVLAAGRSTPGNILARQQARLARLLYVLAQGSSLYAQHLQVYMEPIAQLRRLPVVHKAELMERFDKWVTDPEIRERIFGIIASEFERTKEQLRKVFGGSLEERRPRMGKTLQLRARALALLHEQQIATIKEWRAAQKENPAKAEALLPRVLLSINAIASGLRTTG